MQHSLKIKQVSFELITMFIVKFCGKLIFFATRSFNKITANTVGFIIEFNWVTNTVVQITKSVGYLDRNRDAKYMILVGIQQIIFETVMRAN